LKKLSLQSDAELIRDYINGNIAAELSESLQHKLERIEFCRNLIEQYLPKYKCINKLIDEFTINRNQAYTLYYECEVVFSVRQIRIEKCLENIAKSRSVAQQKLDVKGLAMCDKNEIQAIKDFYGDATINKYKNLQPPDMQLLYEPELVNKQLQSAELLQGFIGQLIAEHQQFTSTQPVTIEIG
jgi:hypothetical protein